MNWYRRMLAIVAASGGALGPWYLGPWPAPYDAVPAIDAADCVAAYQPKWAVGSIYERADAQSYANSKINLANPGTFDATEGVAPAWAQNTGWTGDNATMYLVSAPATTDQTYSAFVAYSMPNVFSERIFGFGDGVGGTYAFGYYGRQAGAHGYSNGLTATLPGVVLSGVAGFSGNQPYLNGVPEAAVIPAGAVSTQDVYVVGYNLVGVGVQYSNATVSCFPMYKTPITAQQAAALSWAMDVIRTA